jgi:hypothetical protein
LGVGTKLIVTNIMRKCIGDKVYRAQRITRTENIGQKDNRPQRISVTKNIGQKDNLPQRIWVTYSIISGKKIIGHKEYRSHRKSGKQIMFGNSGVKKEMESRTRFP